MRDLVELLLDGPIKRRMAMPMQIDPDGGGSVEVLLSVRIDQLRPFSFFDNERFLLLPFLHLGERVPEVSVIPIYQLFRGRLSSHSGRVRGALMAYGVSHEIKKLRLLA